jgi:hypothetical protein
MTTYLTRMKIFLSSTFSQDGLWGPLNLLSNVYGEASPPRVQRPGRKADHSPPSSTELKNVWKYISTSPYVFIGCSLIKHTQISHQFFSLICVPDSVLVTHLVVAWGCPLKCLSQCFLSLVGPILVIFCLNHSATCRNINQFCILPTQFICVFRMVLTLNSDYFPEQH